MRRQGGGFGFVVMLVVLAVIFYLAMNNFKSTAPTAIEIKRHNETREAGQDVQPSAPSASADTWNASPPSRPSLETVDKNTSQHASDVKDALSQSH
jgi:cytoskeletal protein RodZ